MPKTCSSCSFRSDSGGCHRNPPSVWPDGSTGWPSVDSDDWCGYHSSRRDPAALVHGGRPKTVSDDALKGVLVSCIPDQDHALMLAQVARAVNLMMPMSVANLHTRLGRLVRAGVVVREGYLYWMAPAVAKPIVEID